MSDLKAETVRSSLFVVRVSLNALRQYVANLDDPASIDRVIREAEIMSTSLKKLHAYIGDEPVNEMPASAGTDIDLAIVTDFLASVRDGRICHQCGGIQAK